MRHIAPETEAILRELEAGDVARIETARSGASAVPAAAPTVCLADVQPEPVDWLWQSWLPRGKHVQVEGPPDCGKTTLAVEIAARLSRGDPLPGDVRRAPVSTLILTAEDGIADTIRPRAEAAGADLSRIHVLTEIVSLGATDGGIAGLATLAGALERTGAALLVVDPLVAFLDVRDAHANALVRRGLAPLVSLCARLNVCLAAIAHLRKSPTGDALTAGNGSTAFVANARCQIAVGRDRDDSELRVMACGKMNLAAKPRSLTFALESSGPVARVAWRGETTTTADELVSPRETEADRTSRDEAADWLRSVLVRQAVPSSDLRRQATEAGLTWRTVERARATLPIEARRLDPADPRSPWLWEWRSGGLAVCQDREGKSLFSGHTATPPSTQEEQWWG